MVVLVAEVPVVGVLAVEVLAVDAEAVLAEAEAGVDVRLQRQRRRTARQKMMSA